MPPILLYDGLCGFCNRTVNFVLEHDAGGSMLFAPLQSAYGQQIIQRHTEIHNIDSVVLVEPAENGQGERVSVKSDAALRIALYLGGAWRLMLVARIVPRVARDWFYDIFARYRYRIFGHYDACPIPSRETRARFIDTA